MSDSTILERILQHIERPEEPSSGHQPPQGFGNARGEQARLAWMMGLGGDIESIQLTETHFQLDLEGRWLHGDNSWPDITGKQPEESTGFAWVSVLAPSALGKLHEAFVTMVQQGASFWEEITIVSSDTPKSAFLELSKSPNNDGLVGRLTVGATSCEPYLQAPNDSGNILWNRMHKIGKASLILGAAAACLSAIAFSWHSLSTANKPSTPLIVEEKEDPAQEARAAEAVLRHYHESPTLEERAQWIIGGSSLLPEMRNFYEEGNQPSSPVASIHRWDILTIDGDRHYVAQGLDQQGERFLTLINLMGQAPKVNWEASVGYGEMSLDTFTKTQPKTPVLIRLFARPDDYYNHAFSDSAKFACFALDDGDESGSAAYAYVARRSEAYEQLIKRFPGYQASTNKPIRTLAAANFNAEQLTPKKVTLRVAFNTPTAGPAQIEIKEILGQQWVVAMNLEN